MSDYKWVVHPHSFAGRGHREISVVHEINFHGLKSYGWFDARKIHIANDNMYGTLNDDVAKAAIVIAKDMAIKLNKESQISEKEIKEVLEFKLKQDESLRNLSSPEFDDMTKRMAEQFIKGVEDSFESYIKGDKND